MHKDMFYDMYDTWAKSQIFLTFLSTVLKDPFKAWIWKNLKETDVISGIEHPYTSMSQG